MAYRVVEEEKKAKFRVVSDDAKAPRVSSNADYATRLGAELTQGITFQAADELGGLVGAAASYLDPRAESDVFSGMPFMDRYRAIRDEARGRQGEFREQYPAASTTANLGGAIAQGVATAGTSLGPMMAANPTGTGTVYGLLGGYFGSESDDPLQVAADTAQGGATGLLMGRLTQPTANSLGAMWTLPQRYRANAMASLPERLVLRDITRDGLTPEKVAANLRKMPAGATIADAGGENTRRLGEKIVALPGKAAGKAMNILRERRSKAPARVEALIDDVFGQKGSAFHSIQKNLEEEMRARAKPFYDAAYETPVNQTPRLKSIFDRLSKNYPSLISRARQSASVEGVGDDTFQFYDYLKREIDDVIGSAKTQGKGNRARIFTNIKNELLDELDSMSPDYAKGRAIWSGNSKMLQAMELGRKFMREDAEDIADTLADMTEGEIQMFRLGAARFLRDKMLSKSDTADVAKAWFNNPLNREKINAVLGEDRKAFAKLARGMISEGKMFEGGTAMTGNSATARRVAGLLDLADDQGLQAQAIAEGPKSAIFSGLRKLWQDRGGALANEDVRDRIAELIFQGDPAQRQQIMNRLMRTPNARFVVPPMQYVTPLGPQPLVGMPISPAAGLPASAGSVAGLLSSPASARR